MYCDSKLDLATLMLLTVLVVIVAVRFASHPRQCGRRFGDWHGAQKSNKRGLTWRLRIHQQCCLTHWSSTAMVLDGLNVAYREAGDPSRPKLVLLHDRPDSTSPGSGPVDGERSLYCDRTRASR